MEDCNGLARYLIIVLFGSQRFIKMLVYKVVEKDSDWLGSFTGPIRRKRGHACDLVGQQG
jgi:hypothetical protein